MFGYDQAYHEEMEYEFNARYDYVREAFAGTGDDPNMLEAERQYHEEMMQLRDDYRNHTLVLTLITYYDEERYNPVAKATIPGAWKAHVTEDISYILDSPPFMTHVVEGIGRTEQDAIAMLVGQLQSLGMHGKLRRMK